MLLGQFTTKCGALTQVIQVNKALRCKYFLCKHVAYSNHAYAYEYSLLLIVLVVLHDVLESVVTCEIVVLKHCRMSGRYYRRKLSH